jgi:membrane protein DedA with SNARE-associated domain
MRLLPFCVVTLIGATVWNTFLLLLGKKLRDHWTVVQKYSHQADIVIVAILGIGALWWYFSRREKKPKTEPQIPE